MEVNGDGAGHVADGFGGFPAGGDAAALVDGHIDDHRTRPHALHKGLVYKGGGTASLGFFQPMGLIWAAMRPATSNSSDPQLQVISNRL